MFQIERKLYTPEHFNAELDDITIIGAVALPGGPASITISDLPQVAVANSMNGSSNIKSTGKKETMFTITAIFADEFVSNHVYLDYPFAPQKLPCSMVALISELNAMPFIPIYSKHLFSLLGFNDNPLSYEYGIFAVLNSIRVTSMNDFDHAYQVDMQFFLTNMRGAVGGTVYFVDDTFPKTTMYNSKKIIEYIDNYDNPKGESLANKIRSNNIYKDFTIGIDLEEIEYKLRSYADKVRSAAQKIYAQDKVEQELKNLEESFEQLHENIEKANAYLLKEAGKLNSDVYSVELYDSPVNNATRIRFNTVTSVAVGYDNMFVPIFTQAATIPMHSLISRSPNSGTLTIVVQDARSAASLKMLHSFLQEFVSKFDFMDNTLPCSIENELANMFGIKNATLTRIDVQASEELQNAFVLRINFASNSFSKTSENLLYLNSRIAEKIAQLTDKAVNNKETNLDNIFAILDDSWSENYDEKAVSKYLAEPYRNILKATYLSFINLSTALYTLIETMNYSSPEEYTGLEPLMNTINKMTNSQFCDMFALGSKRYQLYEFGEFIALLKLDNNFRIRFSEALLTSLSIINGNAAKYGDEGIRRTASEIATKLFGKTLPEEVMLMLPFLKTSFFKGSIKAKSKKKVLYNEEIFDTRYNWYPIFSAIGRNIDGEIFGEADLKDLNIDYKSIIVNSYKEYKDKKKTREIEKLENIFNKFYFSNAVVEEEIILNEELPDSEYRLKLKFLKIIAAIYTAKFIYSYFNRSGIPDENIGDTDILKKLKSLMAKQIGYEFVPPLLDLLEQNEDEIVNTLKNNEKKSVNAYGSLVVDVSNIELEDKYIPSSQVSFIYDEPMPTIIKRFTDSITTMTGSNIDEILKRALENPGDITEIIPCELIADGRYLFENNVADKVTKQIGSTQYSIFEIKRYKHVLTDDQAIASGIIKEDIKNGETKKISRIVSQEQLSDISTIYKAISNKLKALNNDELNNIVNIIVSYTSVSDPAYLKYYDDINTILNYLTYPTAMRYSAMFGTKVLKIITEYNVMSDNHFVNLRDFYYDNKHAINETRRLLFQMYDSMKDSMVEFTESSEDPTDLLKKYICHLNKQIKNSLDLNPYANAKEATEIVDQSIATNTLNTLNGGHSKIFSSQKIEGNDLIGKYNQKLKDLEEYAASDDFDPEKFKDMLSNLHELQKEILASTNDKDIYSYIEIPNDKSSIMLDSFITEAIMNLGKSVPGIDVLTPVINVFFRWPKKGILLNSTHMFSYDGVISVDISKSKDNPAHTAVVVLSNTSGKLVQQTENNLQEIGNSIDKLLIKPGVEIDIYSGSGENKVLLFRGTIDGVQFGQQVAITASGHGRDLLNPIYNKTEKLGGMATSPREMVVDALLRTGSERFGVNESGIAKMLFRQFVLGENTEQLRLYSDKWLFKALRYDDALTSIYFPDKYWPILAHAKEGSGANNIEQYAADYKAKAGYSAWDVIVDAVRRIPGFVAYVCDYDLGQSRLFFGKPEWYYKFTKIISPKFWSDYAEMERSEISLQTAGNSFTEMAEMVLNNVESDLKNSDSKRSNSIPKSSIYEISLNGSRYYIDNYIPKYDMSAYMNDPNWLSGAMLKNKDGSPFIKPTEIIDGDTFKFTDNNNEEIIVRLFGIDTPEIAKPSGGSEEPYGVQALDAIIKMLNVEVGNYVPETRTDGYGIVNPDSSPRNIVAIQRDTDDYDRKVCNVFVEYDGKYIDLSAFLLLNGLGRTMSFAGGDYSYYYKAESYAMTHKLNIFENYELGSGTIEANIDKISIVLNSTNSAINEIKTIYNDILSWLNSNETDTTKEIKNSVSDYYTKAENLLNRVKTDIESYRDSGKIGTYTSVLSRPTNYMNTIKSQLLLPLNSLYNAITLYITNGNSASLIDREIENMMLSLTYMSGGPEIRKEIEDMFGKINPQYLSEAYKTGKVRPIPGMKPFRNYWLVASDINIISNDVYATDENVANAVVVRGLRQTAQLPVIGQIVKFFKYILGLGPDSDEVDGKMALYRVEFDNDIPEYLKRQLVYEDEWADTTQTRILVGTSVLANSLRNMYQGSIVITGCPDIKPHDVIMLSDAYNDMRGMAVVRSVKHHIGAEAGCVTRIEVEPMIIPRDLHNASWITGIKLLYAIGVVALAVFLAPGIGAAFSGIALKSYVINIGLYSLASNTIKDLFFDYWDIVKPAVSKELDTSPEGEDFDPYGTSKVLYNPLVIKPLIQNNEPMVAGLGGYNLDVLNGMIARMNDAKESLKNFNIGLKVIGHTWKILTDHAFNTISTLTYELKQMTELGSRYDEYEK